MQQLEEERKKRIYIPGDYTDAKHKHYSYEQLVNDTLNPKDDVRTSAQGYPLYREDFAKKPENETRDLKTEVEDMYQQHKDIMCQHIHEKKAKKHSNPSVPFLAAAKNFALAKKLHKENLEHEPLPDTITDALYRKMQLQKGSEPGLVLKDGNYATGVGWKGYPGYGATRCTKLKVYRPKTGVMLKGGYQVDMRPASVSSFDKKWRFIRQEKVTPIELAICWDLTPVDPKNEPKRPTHIDGSNGSQAPAVFSLVHTPKEDDQIVSSSRNLPVAKVEIKCKQIDGCASGSSDTTSSTASCKKCKTPRAKTAWVKRDKSASSESSSSKCSTVKRAQSAYNLQEIEKKKSANKSASNNTSSTNSNLSKKKISHSTPNLSEYQSSYKYCSKECFNKQNKKLPNNRVCVACELKNVNIKEKRPRSEFKMAFKAGVPHKTKDKRQDYPEHWRLASVYQHSYKPLHTRKRPLLATVFQ